MENTYPVWRFHEEKEPEGHIVRSAEEDKNLGEGWVDSPNKFKGTKPESVVVPSEVPADEPSKEVAEIKITPKAVINPESAWKRGNRGEF